MDYSEFEATPNFINGPRTVSPINYRSRTDQSNNQSGSDFENSGYGNDFSVDVMANSRRSLGYSGNKSHLSNIPDDHKFSPVKNYTPMSPTAFMDQIKDVTASMNRSRAIPPSKPTPSSSRGQIPTSRPFTTVGSSPVRPSIPPIGISGPGGLASLLASSQQEGGMGTGRSMINTARLTQLVSPSKQALLPKWFERKQQQLEQQANGQDFMVSAKDWARQLRDMFHIPATAYSTLSPQPRGQQQDGQVVHSSLMSPQHAPAMNNRAIGNSDFSKNMNPQLRNPAFTNDTRQLGGEPLSPVHSQAPRFGSGGDSPLFENIPNEIRVQHGIPSPSTFSSPFTAARKPKADARDFSARLRELEEAGQANLEELSAGLRSSAIHRMAMEEEELAVGRSNTTGFSSLSSSATSAMSTLPPPPLRLLPDRASSPSPIMMMMDDDGCSGSSCSSSSFSRAQSTASSTAASTLSSARGEDLPTPSHKLQPFSGPSLAPQAHHANWDQSRLIAGKSLQGRPGVPGQGSHMTDWLRAIPPISKPDIPCAAEQLQSKLEKNPLSFPLAGQDHTSTSAAQKQMGAVNGFKELSLGSVRGSPGPISPNWDTRRGYSEALPSWQRGDGGRTGMDSARHSEDPLESSRTTFSSATEYLKSLESQYESNPRASLMERFSAALDDAEEDDYRFVRRR